MNILITAGGTSEKIDEVRKVTNMSTGKLGAKICAEVIRQREGFSDTIFYLCAKHAIHPEYPDKKSTIQLHLVNYESAQDLRQAIEGIMRVTTMDIIVHSAAVSDFTTSYVTDSQILAHELSLKLREIPCTEWEHEIQKLLVSGAGAIDTSSKVSSSREDLIVSMKQNEKIISLFKLLQPYTFLVGFKLLYDVADEHLFDVAFKLLRKNRCNLVLANDLEHIRLGKHQGMLVYPEKTHDMFEGKDTIAENLVRVMFARCQVRHPQSICVQNYLPQSQEINVKYFRMIGEELGRLGVLPHVENGTYGNMSARYVGVPEKEMLITGRNVDKEHITSDKLVEIRDYVFNTPQQDKDVYASIQYKGSVKPSIDTAIHAQIYQNTDFRAIIHTHTQNIYPYPITGYNYPCGSEPEMQDILSLIKRESQPDIVQMTKHGLIFMGETLEDCLWKVKQTYEEEISIAPFDEKKDRDELWEEWVNHLYEVYPNSEYVHPSDEYYCIYKGTKKVGILNFTKSSDNAYNFFMYASLSIQGKGYNVAGKVLQILTELALSKGIDTLRLHTTDGCCVQNYYTKKQGFTYEKTVEGLISLIKPVKEARQ